jgi:hypothetical protein
MNQPDPNYSDLLSPDSPPSRRRVVSALAQVYGEGRASPSVDAGVFEAIDGIGGVRSTNAPSRRSRLVVFGGGLAAAAVICVVALGVLLHGSTKTAARDPSRRSVDSTRLFLNRAAAALPADSRVVRLAYIQSTGSPPRAQRVFVWLGAVPGGYHVASSSTADGTSNVAAVKLKGRMHELSRSVPVLGVLDGPGDARMLRATLARSAGKVEMSGPLRIAGGRRAYALRLRVAGPRPSSGGNEQRRQVWFYYDARSAVLVAAKGDGWSARLAGREVIPFSRAPQLIRQLLRPDVSGSAPGY